MPYSANWVGEPTLEDTVDFLQLGSTCLVKNGVKMKDFDVLQDENSKKFQGSDPNPTGGLTVPPKTPQLHYSRLRRSLTRVPRSSLTLWQEFY